MLRHFLSVGVACHLMIAVYNNIIVWEEEETIEEAEWWQANEAMFT